MFKQTFIYIEEYPNQTHSFLSNSFNIIVNVMSQLKISEEFIFAWIVSLSELLKGISTFIWGY